jgi:hypothetical protein
MAAYSPRRLTVLLSVAVLALFGTAFSAHAASQGGLDTSGTAILPFAINGTEVMNLQGDGLHFDPGEGVFLVAPLKVNEGWSPAQGLEINSNQIWKNVTTGDNSLYLQWSNPGGPVVIGGQPGASNNLLVNGSVGIQASPIRGLTVGGGEIAIVKQANTWGFLNVSDANANGGGNLQIRGLNNGGTAGVSLGQIDLMANTVTIEGALTATGGAGNGVYGINTSGGAWGGVFTGPNYGVYASGSIWAGLFNGPVAALGGIMFGDGTWQTTAAHPNPTLIGTVAGGNYGSTTTTPFNAGLCVLSGAIMRGGNQAETRACVVYGTPGGQWSLLSQGTDYIAGNSGCTMSCYNF